MFSEAGNLQGITRYVGRAYFPGKKSEVAAAE